MQMGMGMGMEMRSNSADTSASSIKLTLAKFALRGLMDQGSLEGQGPNSKAYSISCHKICHCQCR